MLGRFLIVAAAAGLLAAPADAATIREIVRDAMKTASDAADSGVANYERTDKPALATKGAKKLSLPRIARYRSMYKPATMARPVKKAKFAVPKQTATRSVVAPQQTKAKN